MILEVRIMLPLERAQSGNFWVPGNVHLLDLHDNYVDMFPFWSFRQSS